MADLIDHTQAVHVNVLEQQYVPIDDEEDVTATIDLFPQHASVQAVHGTLVAINEPLAMVYIPVSSDRGHQWFHADAGYYAVHGRYVWVL